MKLIIQPDDGIAPLLVAIKRAKKTIDIVIFRFDRVELAKALAAAVGRGVVVRALVAHTNRGGEKRLRKLEMTFLEAGVTVCRTADDLTRHHGKMMIVDGELYVFTPRRREEWPEAATVEVAELFYRPAELPPVERAGRKRYRYRLTPAGEHEVIRRLVRYELPKTGVRWPRVHAAAAPVSPGATPEV